MADLRVNPNAACSGAAAGFVDEDPSHFDDKDFVRGVSDVDKPIFSMMYLRGTVNEGKLKGRWTPPGPSPTNSVLLWLEAFTYFWEQAGKFIEDGT